MVDVVALSPTVLDRVWSASLPLGTSLRAFAAGTHMTPPVLLAVAVFVDNVFDGVLFGRVFCHWSLETAMLSHERVHVVFVEGSFGHLGFA